MKTLRDYPSFITLLSAYSYNGDELDLPLSLETITLLDNFTKVFDNNPDHQFICWLDYLCDDPELNAMMEVYYNIIGFYDFIDCLVGGRGFAKYFV